MKKRIFRGVATAMITPLKDDKIDYPALERLIDRQIAAGVSALVIGGTTGEAATLSDKERRELYERSRELTEGRIKLILGTGSPDTKKAIEYTRAASAIGADGALVITPYYNKGTREGLYRHFEAISECSDLPVILYNVPTRTGVNLDLDTLARLCELARIVGIKEASDSADRYAQLMTLDLDVYAGADAMTYSVLACGGAGVVSVVSNLYPEDCVSLCKQFFAGNYAESLEIQKKLLPVINSLFLDTNPAPIKFAMSRAGYCTPEMRLPMWLPTERCRERICAACDAYEGK